MSKKYYKSGTKSPVKEKHKRTRKREFKLGSNIRSFLVGAALALLPVTLYGFIKLNPNSNHLKLRLSETRVPQVLASKVEKPESEARLELLKIDYESLPTATPEPTKAPPKATTVKITASVQIQKPVIPADISGLIELYASQYGVNKDIMIHIAKCESGFRPNAISGPYAGIYQFVGSTWISNRKTMGLDPDPSLRFSAEESIKTAAFKMSRDGFGAWPVCQSKAKRLLGMSS